MFAYQVNITIAEKEEALPDNVSFRRLVRPLQLPATSHSLQNNDTIQLTTLHNYNISNLYEYLGEDIHLKHPISISTTAHTTNRYITPLSNPRPPRRIN